jgi:MSHA biogenesis protein MshL
VKNTRKKSILAPAKMAGALLLGLVLAACETGPARQNSLDEMRKTIDEGIAAQEAAGKEPPESVKSALIPSLSLGITRLPKLEDEQRFDISVNNVPADQFFMSLVDGTKYNMVVHPEVRGNITLNLSNVTIPAVLEAVRDVYGYEFLQTEYGFQVLPGRLQARVYQINFLNVQRAGDSRILVSSGSLLQAGTAGARTGDQGRTTGPARAGRGQNVATVLSTDIQTRQPATTFWDELAASLQAIVGTGEGRSVVVNPQSGVVVVRALPTELREVEQYLEATQLIVQRQVILEAKILEVTLNDRFQTGINWGAVLGRGDEIKAANIGGGSILVNESGTSDIAGFLTDLDPTNPIPLSSALSSAFGGVFTLVLDLGDFQGFIELLKTQGNVQVLSSPRVATMNNQKAVIKVGTDEFFVTDVTTTTLTGVGAAAVTPTVTLTPFFSGIALDVTPQISQDGFVTLHVHPSVSEVVDQQKTVTIGNQVQQLPLARSTVRETDSIVRARSGQVIVIGGLMQNSIDDQQAATPLLGDVPVLGSLFKHTRKESVKSELVILLRPVVVDTTTAWSDAMQQSSDSLQNLKNQLEGQQWSNESLYKSQ